MGVPTSRVSLDSIENFCKHCQGAMKITTRSIAQEQHAEVAAEVVQEVLQDDLYQDPIQVGYRVTILDLCCSVVECFVFFFVFHFFPYLYGCSVLF